MDLPEILYHYTSLETFMNYILPSKQLKLSKIKSSRDPYEYKAFRYRGFEDEPLGKDKGFEKFLEAARDLKMNSQYLCFTMTESKKKENGWYFTRWGYDRPKLWELYGNKHKGVCIEFDTKKIISSFNKNKNTVAIGKFENKEVCYKDIVSRSDLLKTTTLADHYREQQSFELNKFIETFKEAFFFQKDIDYKDENEYRLLYITDKEQEDIKFNIADSITELYFGDLVDKDFLNFYYEIIKQSFTGIEFQQIRWFNGSVETTKYEDD